VAVLLWEDIYASGVPTWATSLLTSSVFLGCIVGMLALGYLGDVLGRPSAMAITLVSRPNQ
jgi:MFS family permease